MVSGMGSGDVTIARWSWWRTAVRCLSQVSFGADLEKVKQHPQRAYPSTDCDQQKLCIVSHLLFSHVQGRHKCPSASPNGMDHEPQRGQSRPSVRGRKLCTAQLSKIATGKYPSIDVSFQIRHSVDDKRNARCRSPAQLQQGRRWCSGPALFVAPWLKRFRCEQPHSSVWHHKAPWYGRIHHIPHLICGVVDVLRGSTEGSQLCDGSSNSLISNKRENILGG